MIVAAAIQPLTVYDPNQQKNNYLLPGYFSDVSRCKKGNKEFFALGVTLLNSDNWNQLGKEKQANIINKHLFVYVKTDKIDEKIETLSVGLHKTLIDIFRSCKCQGIVINKQRPETQIYEQQVVIQLNISMISDEYYQSLIHQMNISCSKV